ncbi:MAG: multiheme c-type cytochrome [Rhodothermales bacterium]
MLFPVLHYLSAEPIQEQEASPYLRNDPEKITLSAKDSRVPCGECHTLEYDAWKESSHSTGFDSMHRSAQAQSILEKLDYKLAKRESVCLTCHYTAEIQRDQARAIAGVSCESCHGEARDWLDLHNNYGAPDRASETPAHKAERIQSSKDAGMLRPSDDVYAVAANCFECHTVPSEELINVGRHPSGSRIELVEWSGKIQHNFLAAQWGGDEANREQTPERKRTLYVIGRVLDYEYSLRGAAKSTEQGSFSKAMERRVVTALRELDKIASVISVPELNAIIQLQNKVKLVPNNEAALLGIAEEIRVQGKKLASNNDGAAWAAVDALIKGGGGVPEPATEGEVGSNTGAVGATPAGSSAAESAPGASSGVAATPTAALNDSAPVATVQVDGQKRAKPTWFAQEKFEFTVPGCNCHASAEDWLFDDPHGRSAQPVSGGSARAVQIATLYGLSAKEMKQGNQICMQCHGTVESGTGAGPVFESVGCESCHGPSSGYLQPHKRGQGAQFGLRNLSDATVRAANCAQCHHITDERLLASGHSAGQGYNVATGNNAIKHWPDPDLDRPPKAELGGDALKAAFDRIKGQRPVPQVTVAKLPTVAAPVRSSARPSASSSSAGAVSTPPRVPRNRPVAGVPRASSGSGAINLAPAPAISDSASVEEILLVVKKRLEEVYKALGRNE